MSKDLDCMTIVNMQKIGHEIKFEELLKVSQQELFLLQKKPSQDRVDSLKSKVKELEKTTEAIREALFSNSRVNRRDADLKVTSYRTQVTNLKKECDSAEIKMMQEKLFKNRTPGQPLTEE